MTFIYARSKEKYILPDVTTGHYTLSPNQGSCRGNNYYFLIATEPKYIFLRESIQQKSRGLNNSPTSYVDSS